MSVKLATSNSTSPTNRVISVSPFSSQNQLVEAQGGEVYNQVDVYPGTLSTPKRCENDSCIAPLPANINSSPTDEVEKQKKIAEMKLKFPELFQEEIGEDDDDDVCPICLELFTETNPAIPCDCTHQFHFQCVEEWLQRSAECPVCYNKLKYELMSSEQEIAFARQQLGYQSPQQIHASNNQRLMRVPYEAHSYGSNISSGRRATTATSRTASTNITLQQATNHSRVQHRTSTSNNNSRSTRSRGLLGKLFDRIFSSVLVPHPNSNSRSRRSQTVY